MRFNKGTKVRYYFGVNGPRELCEGIVQSVDTRSDFARAYGKQIKLTDGHTVNACDVLETIPRTQLPKVPCTYGAPMGRRECGALSDTPRSVRLFSVRIDAGGYDEGGAYWGRDIPLYCAQDENGDCQFVRAGSREWAMFILNIPLYLLARPVHGAMTSALAIIDGKAPMPKGHTRESIIGWMQASGAHMGQAS